MYKIRFYCPDCQAYQYLEQEVLSDSVNCPIHLSAIIRDFIVLKCDINGCACHIENTSSVSGDTVTNALETLDTNKSEKSSIFTNTVLLQSNGANYETISHNLAEQFIQVTVMYKPEGSGEVYQNQWISADNIITIVYYDANNIRIYNDSISSISIGNCKIIIQK